MISMVSEVSIEKAKEQALTFEIIEIAETIETA